MFGPRRNIAVLLVLVLVVVMGFSLIIVDFKLKASVLEIAKAQAQVRGAETISRVVNEQVVSQVEYKDIVSVHKDSKGRIVMVQPNTVMLNKIMADTIIQVSRGMGEMEEETISVPLGQLSGSHLLAGYGPRVMVKTIAAGQVHVNVLNKFEQSGINQTRHLIYFEINSDIKIAVPFMKEEVKVSTIIPLAETIIVGEVPETYVNFTGGSEALYPFIEPK